MRGRWTCWSVELSELYAAAVEGREAFLPHLPVQYADFAVWQRSGLGELGGQLEYSREALAGVEPLELPTDRRRPVQRSGAGGFCGFVVPVGVADGLRDIAREYGASLFMVGMAALQVLLSRYSGQTDIAVGTPITGRARTEVDGLIGFFLNTLVLRGDLAGDPSFVDFLEQVKGRSLDAFDHQDLPFEQLVEELAPERELGRTPFFQVMFVQQSVSRVGWSVSGLDFEAVPVGAGVEKFDLSVFMGDTGDGLEVGLSYSKDLFDQATVERMAGHFQAVLAGVVADPGVRLSGLELLGEAERRQLLHDWNDTGSEYSLGRGVHELVEEQARIRPAAVAVVCGEVSLTYQELNARANQMAHHLRDRGVTVGTLVGVCAERSLELIIGLLGVLKSGGAYVPLDPDHPAGRRDFVLRDTGISLVLVQRGLRDRVADFSGDLVFLESVWEAGDSQPVGDLAQAATSDDLAYVIYTSGSTGTPKGVQIEHRNVVNYLEFMRDYVHMTCRDVVAQTTPFSFDVFAHECWLTLSTGAKLVIIEQDTLLDARSFRKAIVEEKISVVRMVASLFNQHLVEYPELASEVRVVSYGGEAVERSIADAVIAGGYAPEMLLHFLRPY